MSYTVFFLCFFLLAHRMFLSPILHLPVPGKKKCLLKRNIGIFLKNISDEPQIINIGDKIGQGLFVKYLVTDNDKVTKTRKGGFGSTND